MPSLPVALIGAILLAIILAGCCGVTSSGTGGATTVPTATAANATAVNLSGAQVAAGEGEGGSSAETTSVETTAPPAMGIAAGTAAAGMPTTVAGTGATEADMATTPSTYSTPAGSGGTASPTTVVASAVATSAVAETSTASSGLPGPSGHSTFHLATPTDGIRSVKTHTPTPTMTPVPFTTAFIGPLDVVTPISTPVPFTTVFIGPLDVVTPAVAMPTTAPCAGEVEFTGVPRSGRVPLTVTFTVTAECENTYTIDFGDGQHDLIRVSPPATKSVTHTYNEPGTYTVRVTQGASMSSTWGTSRDGYITVRERM